MIGVSDESVGDGGRDGKERERSAAGVREQECEATAGEGQANLPRTSHLAPRSLPHLLTTGDPEFFSSLTSCVGPASPADTRVGNASATPSPLITLPVDYF